MITVESIKATTLEDYYRQLVAAQEKAHGADYCSHHTIIRQAAKEWNCHTYAELGVKQGTTLACAMLAGFRLVEGVDIALAPWRPYESIFRAYARTYQVHLNAWEQRSNITIGEMDFLLIDTQHNAPHVRNELAVHGPNAKRFILIHDTAAVPALHVTAAVWATAHGWTVQQRELRNVGWTLLSRES